MANSIIEVEYIVIFDATKEAVWIKKFITKLSIIPSTINLVHLYCDNNGTITQIKEPRFH